MRCLSTRMDGLMRYKLLVVGVKKEDTNEAEGDVWEPSRQDVAEIIGEKVIGRDHDTGWDIVSVDGAHLDIDTMAQMVADAKLDGRQTVELMGRITSDSISRHFKEVMDNAAPDVR